VPLRADGLPVWALRSPGLRIAAHAHLPEASYLSGAFRAEAPRSQLRDSSGFTPDSLGAPWNLTCSRPQNREALEVGGSDTLLCSTR